MSCTAAAGSGRTVGIAENERLQHKLRKLQRPAPAERSSASASSSSTSSPTSLAARAAAPATAACARTSSTSAAPAPSRTSRRSSRRQPNEIDFKPVGVLGHGPHLVLKLRLTLFLLLGALQLCCGRRGRRIGHAKLSNPLFQPYDAFGEPPDVARVLIERGRSAGEVGCGGAGIRSGVRCESRAGRQRDKNCESSCLPICHRRSRRQVRSRIASHGCVPFKRV